MGSSQVGLCMVASWDSEFVGHSLRSFAQINDRFVFVSDVGWDGEPDDSQACAREAELAGATVIRGSWDNEADHRRAALDYMREAGYRHVLIPDADEIVSDELLQTLTGIASLDLADIVRVRMATYLLSPTLRVTPDETLAPILMLNCQKVEHRYIREYEAGGEGRLLVLSPQHGRLHHLSWVGTEDRIKRKVATSSHAPEFVPDWMTTVWDRLKEDKTLKNLHPTHPACYSRVERIPMPSVLEGVPDLHPAAPNPDVPPNWVPVSIVIPVFGGPQELRACLESIVRANAEGDLPIVTETILVDDASPDDAPEVAASFPEVKLIRNEQNLGFAASCMRGYEASEGKIVVFLNSDTIICRAAFIRLVESLLSSGSVGASGPYTNNASYHQPFPAGYSDVANYELFARDFADRSEPDLDVPMLVGFCIAVRRSVIEEIGGWDTDFGRGLFEDNDLSYRIQRAGYKLRLSSRSYIHHEGSKSLPRMGIHPQVLLKKNRALFESKWRLDIETGFASHLPGQKADPIRFDPEKEPALVKQKIKKLAKCADISLCMIVRNEERVLGACLSSVEGLFAQTVIVDTGSTDRTIEIAELFGAEVSKIVWPDSFAEARNESICKARGKWVMWLDADDTVEFSSLLKILTAVTEAPREIAGFVIPVRFVEEGPNAGTQVDHVKLFRNRKGIAFTGCIHEQILPALRESGGQIVPMKEVVVLHSGYDASPDGQLRKRVRDRPLLARDLRENPNHPFKLFNLGMTSHFTGKHRSAIGWLKRSIQNSGPGDSHLRKAYALLGTSHAMLGRPEVALEIYREGLRKVGDDPELNFRIGAVLGGVGRIEEAIDAYKSVVPSTEGFFSSVDLGILTFKRFGAIAALYETLGRHGEAVNYWREAIRSNPHHVVAPVDMFNACMRRCDFGVAFEATEVILAAHGANEMWADMRAHLATARGQNAEAELAALVHQHPMSTAPGMLLADRLLAAGREAEAQPLLKRLDDLGCAKAVYYRGVGAARAGDFKTAIYHTERALQLEPDNQMIANQLGHLRELMQEED